jgi:MFS family permease
MLPVIATLSTQPESIPLGHRRHLALGSFWFGLFSIWTPMVFVLLPAQVATLVADKAAQAQRVGFIVGAGAIFSMVVPPLVGAWSDRLQTRFGRRRPILVAGALGTVAGLLVMLTAGSLTQLLVGYVLLQLFSNGAGAAFFGLIPDVVPESETGKASAYLAAMVQFGSVAGLAISFAANLAGVFRISYGILAFVLVVSLLPTLWAAGGEGSSPARPAPALPLGERLQGFFRPLFQGDFGLVVFTRMAMVSGYAAVTPYLQYFFRDVVHVSDPFGFTSIWSVILLVAAGISGYLGGSVSDRYGRKIFVYASGAVQALVVLYFIVFYPTVTPVVMATAVVFGLGYGLYYAVDWALACDTLPDRGAAAKDLGLFHVAMTLPNSVVTAAAGIALAYLNTLSPLSGYRWVFGTAALFFLVGTILVNRLKTVR